MTKRAVSFATVRRMALALPGVEEGTSYGTPAFKVRGKLLLRLRDDGETLALRASFDDRDFLMAAEPQSFFITDHYRNYPAVVVRLATVDPDILADAIEHTWRGLAPKKVLAQFDGE